MKWLIDKFNRWDNAYMNMMSMMFDGLSKRVNVGCLFVLVFAFVFWGGITLLLIWMFINA